MSKYIKLDIAGSLDEGEKINLQEFEDVVPEDKIYLIKDLVINNLALLVQDKNVKQSLFNLGYKNIDEAKNIHEKVLLSANYMLVSRSGYVVDSQVIVEKMRKDTLKRVMSGEYCLLQAVDHESLKEAESLKDTYAKADKEFKLEENNRKKLAAKKAESKKKREIEKAKKILAEAGEKV